MAVLSRLLLAANCQKLSPTNGLLQKLLSKNNSYMFQIQNGTRRCMSGHHMEVTPTRWQWHKTKDLFHFYFFLGFIPVISVITYANVFIGHATLEPIPEGYIPKEWEYYKHPIQRFLAKYCMSSPQMEYEKFLHRVNKDYNKQQLKKLEQQIREQIQHHSDYKYFSYRHGVPKQIIDIRKRIDAGDLSV